MNVFKTVITALVISTVLLATQSAHALWAFPVTFPQQPNISNARFLNNPTVAQIQQAIGPGRRIHIAGRVDASAGGTLHIEHDDVQLNFVAAQPIEWRGGDTWEGFLNIHSSRVQIIGLRLNVMAGPGRCRGVVIGDASDVLIGNCTFQNTADGLVGDGRWARLQICGTKFLNCSNWVNENMPGGYGIFLEDDDAERDDLIIQHVTITLGRNSGQHGIRLSQVQHALIDNSVIGANEKRSFWAYGVDCVAIRRSTFNDGSVLFNLMSDEHYTSRPTTRVRMDSCQINHTGILSPVSVYCGRGSRIVQFRNLNITSNNAPHWLAIGWRTAAQSWNLNWANGTITFNGQRMHGRQGVKVTDWNPTEQNQASIGPM